MRAIALVLGLAACSGSPGDTSDTTDTTPFVCDDANEDCGIDRNCGGEGDNMLPGSDCISCHDGVGFEPPEWTLAGTVFSDLGGTDGVEDAVVRVTDAEGTEITMTTSREGNFRSRADVVFPITAVVEYDGQSIAMASEVDDGSCNSCHQCEGPPGGKLHTP